MEIRNKQKRINDLWLSIGIDIGIYISEMLIKKFPYLKWKINKSFSDIEYQNFCLHNFQKTRKKTECISLIYQVYAKTTAMFQHEVWENVEIEKRRVLRQKLFFKYLFIKYLRLEEEGIKDFYPDDMLELKKLGG